MAFMDMFNMRGCETIAAERQLFAERFALMTCHFCPLRHFFRPPEGHCRLGASFAFRGCHASPQLPPVAMLALREPMPTSDWLLNALCFEHYMAMSDIQEAFGACHADVTQLFQFQVCASAVYKRLPHYRSISVTANH